VQISSRPNSPLSDARAQERCSSTTEAYCVRKSATADHLFLLELPRILAKPCLRCCRAYEHIIYSGLAYELGHSHDTRECLPCPGQEGTESNQARVRHVAGSDPTTTKCLCMNLLRRSYAKHARALAVQGSLLLLLTRFISAIEEVLMDREQDVEGSPTQAIMVVLIQVRLNDGSGSRGFCHTFCF
jgi:hypothetical protein